MNVTSVIYIFIYFSFFDLNLYYLTQKCFDAFKNEEYCAISRELDLECYNAKGNLVAFVIIKNNSLYLT